MLRILLLLCLSLVSVACQPQPLFPSPQPTPETPPSTIGASSAEVNQTLDAMLAGEPVSVVTRSNWDTLVAEESILIRENKHSIESSQVIDGILINIFKPDVAGYRAMTDTENEALGLLRYIVERPNYVGNAEMVEPRSFQWGDHDAAYYTLYNAEQRYTLVMAVHLAPLEQIIVVNVSVPETEIPTLRTQLMQSLITVRFENTAFSGEDLTALPDPIPFPSDDVEIATDNTPGAP